MPPGLSWPPLREQHARPSPSSTLDSSPHSRTSSRESQPTGTSPGVSSCPGQPSSALSFDPDTSPPIQGGRFAHDLSDSLRDGHNQGTRHSPHLRSYQSTSRPQLAGYSRGIESHGETKTGSRPLRVTSRTRDTGYNLLRSIHVGRNPVRRLEMASQCYGRMSADAASY